MSKRPQLTSSTKEPSHVACELPKDSEGQIESQDNTMVQLWSNQIELQNSVANIKDDINIIKEQLLMLTRQSEDSGDSSQSILPLEMSCSSSSGDATVSVDGNEIELRNKTSYKGGSCFIANSTVA